jgi:saccharopine dehydrogenase (NAD+, L-lysine-forming)
MHIWMRAESRPNERRAGLMPEGAAELLARGHKVSVEDSDTRIIPTEAYRQAGCHIASQGSWPQAPTETIILGLKELPEDGTPLHHRHIMFGHAFKGQLAGQVLLDRFHAGGGTLLDLEYLVDATGRRVAAFGYWAGYAGAALSLRALAGRSGPVDVYQSVQDMAEELRDALAGHRPIVLIIGALGRVGTGAADICDAVGAKVTKWDRAETAHGGPFPEILDHEVFLNCILAAPGVPVFVPRNAGALPRALRVIGDIACDPDSDFNPVPVYDQATTWQSPTLRVHDDPPLEVMAIDNLPSLLPLESSEDFAAQLLPHLFTLDRIDEGVWHRAADTFRTYRA